MMHDGTMAHMSPKTAHAVTLWVTGSEDEAEEAERKAEDRRIA